MASNFSKAKITSFNNGWVDGTEANTSFIVTGTGTYSGTTLTTSDTLTIVLNYGGGITQTFTGVTITAVGGSGSHKTVTWSLSDTHLSATALTAGFNRSVTATISASSDGRHSATSGTTHFDYITCFARGTRLRTPRGEVPVEALAVGEPIFVSSGRAVPIKWIGHRSLDIRGYRRPEMAAPVCIRRGAFAENVPARELALSPDHAIHVDGVLICARQLINGTTIRQDIDRAAVEYFHVELDEHDIVLAEGLAVESYLDTGNRGFFANGGAPLILRPDLTDPGDTITRQAHSRAPFVSDPEQVRPVWQRLADRAAGLGLRAPACATTDDPALRLRVAGRDIAPLHRGGSTFTFMVPGNTTEVAVVSRAGSPTDTCPWYEDRRDLGVRVANIVVRTADEFHTIPIDHPSLVAGWWDVERDGTAMRRWTNGEATILLPKSSGPSIVEIVLSDTILYAIKSADLRQVA